MVEIGSVLEGEVTRVEPYGVYFRHGADTVLVLAPDVCWAGHQHLKDRFKIGERLRAIAMRYNYKTGEVVGSIRRLKQDDNPYRQLSRLPIGTILSGNARSFSQGVWTVNLPNGAVGQVRDSRADASWKSGDPVCVVITFLDVEEGRMSLEPAPATKVVASAQDRAIVSAVQDQTIGRI